MTETFARKIWEILENKYLMKSFENHLHLKGMLYRFQLKKGTSIGEHLNNYMNFLSDLTNMDEVIKDEDKALILLNSLSGDD